MAKARTRPQARATEEKRSPFSAFLKHQQNALEETGKAVVSLFPPEFREHTKRAMEENKASFEVLWDGLIDGLERGLEKLRPAPKGETPPQAKVKVDVE